MKPTNNKSLFHFICEQLDNLDQGLITIEKAKAFAHLTNQANKSLMYELKRAEVKMQLEVHNKSMEKVELREAEVSNPNS